MQSIFLFRSLRDCKLDPQTRSGFRCDACIGCGNRRLISIRMGRLPDQLIGSMLAKK